MSTSTPSRRRLRASAVPVLAAAVALSLPGVAAAHEFDHPAPGGSPGREPTGPVMSGGQGAVFQFLTSIPTGNPHTDIEFFTKGEETYASVGTLATGANQGGQTIVRLTDKGEVTASSPMYVTGHNSAQCLTDESAALGLQHDVEATPKGDTINNDSFLPPVTDDVQLLLDATDAPGRCHDQGTLGLNGAPRGGLEIIDVTGLGGTTPFDPVEIGLTSHIGQSHTVNVDPKRPHIAYSVTSDTVSVTGPDANGKFTRNNEAPMAPNQLGQMVPNPQRFNLDGFEVVDLSSCMFRTEAVPAGTLQDNIDMSLTGTALRDAKRAACKPEVFRYRYDDLAMVQGTTVKTNINGCHELAIFPNDLLTCGSGTAAMLFDMSGAFDAEGKPKGTPLDCRQRPSSSTAPGGFRTGALVTDCVNGGADGTKSLDVAAWLANKDETGLPKERLEGVEYLGSQNHLGRAPTAGAFTQVPATEDIDFNHETELTQSGRFLLATDERGGGVAGGSQCSQGNSTPPQANGGVHAYRVDRLQKAPSAGVRQPTTPETGTALTRKETDEGYARAADGTAKSIYRAPIRTGAEPTFCTAHVLQQVPGQNRIVMGWYTQGTQIVDYVELPGSRLQFVETGFAIPAEANTWVSHVFKAEENEDGTFTYFGATGDIDRGRIDVFKVTMPEPLTACDLKAGTAQRSTPSTVADREQAREVHRENVDCALNYKISSGKTVDANGVPTSYAPLEDVTRGQMARFVANAIDASGAGDSLPAATGADRFSDIAGTTHRDAIQRLAQAGIVKGAVGGTFDPDAIITRAQMASFIVEAARVAGDRTLEPASLGHFGDVASDSTHARNINAGFEAGLFRGTVAPTDGMAGSFSPAVTVKRDQMATFLVELFTQSIR